MTKLLVKKYFQLTVFRKKVSNSYSGSFFKKTISTLLNIRFRLSQKRNGLRLFSSV